MFYLFIYYLPFNVLVSFLITVTSFLLILIYNYLLFWFFRAVLNIYFTICIFFTWRLPTFREKEAINQYIKKNKIFTKNTLIFGKKNTSSTSTSTSTNVPVYHKHWYVFYGFEDSIKYLFPIVIGCTKTFFGAYSVCKLVFPYVFSC